MLRLEHVTRRFGGIEAVQALDLAVPAGARLGLIGPNGSGKTTLLNLISGVLRPDSGLIHLGSVPLEALSAHGIAALGVARTFQNLRLVPHMTVRENVWLAQHSLPGASALRRGTEIERRRAERVTELLAALDLAGDAPVSSLPLPHQRRVELARALAREPKLVLLDEPAGGMTATETETMGDLIRRLVPPEVTLILVEHKIDLVIRLCPRIVVLDFGRKIAEGVSEEVLRRPDVMQVYFGTLSSPANAGSGMSRSGREDHA